MQNAEYRIQNTEYRIQNTEYRIRCGESGPTRLRRMPFKEAAGGNADQQMGSRVQVLEALPGTDSFSIEKMLY